MELYICFPVLLHDAFAINKQKLNCIKIQRRISVVKRKLIGDSGSCCSILHPDIDGYHLGRSKRVSFYATGNNLE
jgi:hypothetical protein